MTVVGTPLLVPTAVEKIAERKAPPATWGVLELFVVSQTFLPALLYLPGTQSIRVPIRVGAFGVSLALFGLWLLQRRRDERSHPAGGWLVATLIWLGLQIFHPTTNSPVAGLAQVFLYLSVIAPVFWAPRFVREPSQVRRVLGLLLICNGANAAVGVLQVVDPDTWLPRELTSVYENPLTYIGPQGTRIVRPPGLSDNPGAVCGPAANAAVLGIVFCADTRLVILKRLASLAIGFVGIAAVYLSHVRTSILILAGCLVVYVVALLFQREFLKAGAVAGITFGLLLTAYLYAVSLGGPAVSERFLTLLDDDPNAVYYKAGRGFQIEYAFRVQVWEYPLGAGLARWGMMRYYFGDEANKDSPMIWAELQFPAWLLDGGVPLILLYLAAVLGTCRYEIGLLGMKSSRPLRTLATMVFAANLGTVALSFGYTPFTTNVGVQYWFLAGILFGLANVKRNPVT